MNPNFLKKYLAVAGFLLALSYPSAIFSQIQFTANDPSAVPPYNNYFLFGANMGPYFSWDDKSIADIAAGNASRKVKGAGVKSLHTKLYEDFLETWSYDARVNEFNHYGSLGIRDNAVFLDIGATAAHKDNNKYAGCTDESNLYKNMYEPIWDGGANGTPVNENNYYALFVYKTVTKYKANTRFWEIINEPDFTYSDYGWRPRGMAGNWWENNPSPCDLQNLKAPIFHYIRLLRISYEVIKYVDPSAYVATGGIGHPGFLDAVLRNTDNPADGSANEQYPKTGGAWFDCLSFHYYPFFDMRFADANYNWVFTRHSDAAVAGYIRRKNELNAVLTDHGYNGVQYPQKIWVCTETGVPRKQFYDWIGSEKAQINYALKAIVESQKNDIRQMYIMAIGEAQDNETANDWKQTMGLYQNLTGKGPIDIYHQNTGAYNQQYNNLGIAYKTISDLLLTWQYDASSTASLQLPADVSGGAFRNSLGEKIYVLWAKTKTDQSEEGSANYSFPSGLNVSPLFKRREWDFSQTGTEITIPAANITLSTTPSFISNNFLSLPLDTSSQPRLSFQKLPFKFFPNPANDQVSIHFTLGKDEEVLLSIYDVAGRLAYKSRQALTKGSHKILIRLPYGLQSGLYHYRFEAGRNIITDKFLMLH